MILSQESVIQVAVGIAGELAVFLVMNSTCHYCIRIFFGKLHICRWNFMKKLLTAD